MQRFAEVYSRLADDELARAALAGHLVPEAKEALDAELQKRGLNDLSEYKRTEAAGKSSLARELEIQNRLRGRLGIGCSYSRLGYSLYRCR